MQIIVKHWTDKNLKSPSKSVNAPLIKEFTGVENYKGRADQIEAVMEYITVENYSIMCHRVRQLEKIDTYVGSSNFGMFMELLESSDNSWIDKINAMLEM
jgi:hypothetical protein